MAFGGVDTGSMKPSEADRATPTATGMGLKPAERAAPMASGPIMFVAAVCDVSSERSRDMTQNTATSSSSEGSPPSRLIIWPPIQPERPVLYIMPPMARPPPKSRSVPHSTPATASFQSRVILRRFMSTGRKNSSSAPIIAAMASGNSLL